jgi:DNA-binding NarL/FixJ family response regulator
LVEDHLMFREVVRKVCVTELGHEIVGESDDGLRAVEMVRATEPELILLDLRLPSLDGLDVLARVRTTTPHIKAIILSSRCDRFTIHAVEKARVQGFVDKNTNSVGVLKAAITAVAEGRTWFSEEYRRARTQRVADRDSFDKILSAHERQVLAVLGALHSVPEAAILLGITEEAVDKQRTRLLEKLRLGSYLDLMRYAQENGFTAGSPPGRGARLQP